MSVSLPLLWGWYVPLWIANISVFFFLATFERWIWRGVLIILNITLGVVFKLCSRVGLWVTKITMLAIYLQHGVRRVDCCKWLSRWCIFWIEVQDSNSQYIQARQREWRWNLIPSSRATSTYSSSFLLPPSVNSSLSEILRKSFGGLRSFFYLCNVGA